MAEEQTITWLYGSRSTDYALLTMPSHLDGPPHVGRLVALGPVYTVFQRLVAVRGSYATAAKELNIWPSTVRRATEGNGTPQLKPRQWRQVVAAYYRARDGAHGS